jgi:hypothetical protein
VATFDYDDIAATVTDALAEFGRPITLTRAGAGGVYDPDTSTVVDVAGEAHSALALQVQLNFRDIAGTLIEANDRSFFIAPDLGVTPKSGDALDWLGERLTVVACQPLNPAGVPLAYTVIARG